jgi:hypothetical protein
VPGVVSVFSTAVLLCPAETTSRSELPVPAVPPTRRALPLGALEEPAQAFSFVLDDSDLESSC